MCFGVTKRGISSGDEIGYGGTYLVMIREWDNTGTDAKKHTGVDFAMGIRVGRRVYLCLQSFVRLADVVFRVRVGDAHLG
jgi:hypothetical protein